MDNLTDYILWMRDVPFSALPFQAPDALVLCMLSYFDFSPTFAADDNGEIFLRDCQRMIDEDRIVVHITGRDRGFRNLLQAAVRSRRFGELRMTDYVDVYRQEPPLQFSAVTFHADDFSFLAYRGTDNSLAGWKEDFMISFTITEAQELALDYARRFVPRAERCYIGGHSKGGNLALYAACGLEKEAWDRVERVFLLDGPGLCPEVMDTEVLSRIDPKTTRIVPCFSVIGSLFAPDIYDTRIVRSDESGFLQHSLDSWGIDHGRLFSGEENPGSRWINEVLADWIGGISQEDRAIFVDDLFDALSAAGAETLEDIQTGGASGLDTILSRLLSSSAVTKKTISDLPKRAILGDAYDDITQKGIAGWLKERYLDRLLPQLGERGKDEEPHTD